MRKNINKVTKNTGRVGKCSQTTDLTTKKGTVSNVMALHTQEINNICMTETLTNAKRKLISLIEKEANNCPSKNRIIYNIQQQRSNDKLLMYMWDMFLKGSGNGVI